MNAQSETYQPDPNRYDSTTYRPCGDSGLKLPPICLGCWHNFGDTTPLDRMQELCTTAFDHGITHFDLADNYGPEPGAAERNMGIILRRCFSHHRQELVISTKAGYEMWRPLRKPRLTQASAVRTGSEPETAGA